MKPLEKSEIKRILVISLTNIGDVILTFPVLDVLRRDCPQAELSVVIGPKARSLLENNPNIKDVFIFDKHQSGIAKMRWVLRLREEHFDLVVDLRNTAIPFLLSARYRTPLAVKSVVHQHMREKHLNRLRTVFPFEHFSADRYVVPPGGGADAAGPLDGYLKAGEKFAVVAPGAANSAKRWPKERFVEICRRLGEKGFKIVLAGDDGDREISGVIVRQLKSAVLDLCGRTDLKQLAAILRRCELAVVNDSGVMHLASYLDQPVVAIFGPSDPQRYGPWSRQSAFVHKGSDISLVSIEEVWEAIEKLIKT